MTGSKPSPFKPRVAMSKNFRKLCGYFFQDIGVENPNQRKWIEFASQHLSADERNEVRSFLEEILNGSQTDRDLQTIWFASSAEIYFPDAADLRGFLKLMHDTIR